ncbi:VCBS domain-containing protein, partial [Vibrio parahaemolyticus]|uniref:T1SS-143 repeat domain-containing protein n=1 Tax=Vibrio parahaemolyticus TaxID=670 RepID=UPI00146BDD00
GRSISLTETTNLDGSFTYSATAEGDAIFTLQVNPDGTYSFTLEGPIDHAVGSDSLTLDFTIVATDFDGDTSSLVLPVTIADDVPTINDVVALTVDEDELSLVGSDQSQSTLVEGQFTTTQGSDGVVQYQL